jgi:hypothetical protein
MMNLNTNSLSKTFFSGAVALAKPIGTIIATLAGIGVVSVPAHAVVTTLGGFCSAQTSLTVGDKRFTCLDTNLDTFSSANDKIEIDLDNAGNYDLSYDFLNDYEGANGAFLKYTVAITDPNFSFLGVGLDSTVSNFGPIENVTKLVEWAGGGSQLLTSTNGFPDEFLFPAGLQFITVTDTINPNGGSVLSFQNTFVQQQQVPEPFTIIGTLIGGTAAFRMRKKLKSTTNA